MSAAGSVPPRWRTGPAAAVLETEPLGFVDVGARDGLPRYWEDVGPLLAVLAFEPDPAEAHRLAASLGRTGARVQVIPSAVWDRAGHQKLFLTRSPGCSSLYEPRSGFLAEFPDARRFEVVSALDVETVRLDAVVSAGSRVRFIKIDAQGGALNILTGAARTLDDVLGLEVEVELAPMYEDEPLFGDIDRHLRARRFELVDLRPTYWRREAGRHLAGTRGQLIFCDSLYLLSPAAFAERAAAADAAGRKQLCASALLICDVYGLVDWVAAYASALARTGLSAAVLDGYLADHRPRRMPAFPLQYHLGLWLKDMGDRLVESSDTWGVAEQRLGSKPRLGRNLARRLWRRIARHRSQEDATR